MTASRLLRAERSEIEEFFKSLKLKFAKTPSSGYVDTGIDCPEIYTGYGTQWAEGCRKLLKKSGMVVVMLALHLPDNYSYLYPNGKFEFVVYPSVILVKGPRRTLTITFDENGQFEKLLDSLEVT